MSELIKINPTLAGLIVTAIELGLNALKNAFVAVPEAVTGITLLQGRLKSTVNALADADPNDKEQLAQIWGDFVGEDLSGFTDDFLATRIAKIEDDNVRSGLAYLAPQVVNMLRLLTDDNPANNEQIRNSWADFVGSEETKALLSDHLIGPALLSFSEQIRKENEN